MARANKRTPQVEEVRPYGDGVANNLLDQRYGPDGPAGGTQRTEIENLCVASREVLNDKLRAAALARPAAAQANGPPP